MKKEQYIDAFYNLHFDKISLTERQEEDAKQKYTGVISKLCKSYYGDSEIDGRFILFGSYGKRTHIRPARDVDVQFIFPENDWNRVNEWNGNKQSRLLQEVKNYLIEKYPNTPIRADEKVVVVEFSDPCHDIEVLPSFKFGEVYYIPDSKDGGRWERWDPFDELRTINAENENSSGKLKRAIKSTKKWVENISPSIKSYITEKHSINAFRTIYPRTDYVHVIAQKSIEQHANSTDPSVKSASVTAQKRFSKAIQFAKDEKWEHFSKEMKKIYGDEFPKQKELLRFIKSDEEYSFKEEFIEDKFPVDINDEYGALIDCIVTQDGFRTQSIRSLSLLKKSKSLEFKLVSTNVPEPFDVYWKVRNYGPEARKSNDLRGEILPDYGARSRKENTRYSGRHIVTCYIIKNNICVTEATINVKIGGEY